MPDFTSSLAGLAAAALSAAALYCLISLGFSISFRVSGFFDLSLGVAFLTSGYVAYSAITWLGSGLLSAMLLGVVAATVVSVVLGFFVIVPLSNKLPALPMFVATLAMLYICQSVLALLFDERVRVLRAEYSPTWIIGGFRLTDVQYSLILSATVVSIALILVLSRTSWGSYARAIADDPGLSAAFGFPVTTTRFQAYAVAGSLAGMAGVFFAADRALDPTQAMAALLAAMVATILGGDTIAGALLGAVVLAVLETGLGFALPGTWKTATAFAVLLMLLAVRGRGAVAVTNRRL
jgi:branched-chain amino acid transport system permease protein